MGPRLRGDVIEPLPAPHLIRLFLVAALRHDPCGQAAPHGYRNFERHASLLIATRVRTH